MTNANASNILDSVEVNRKQQFLKRLEILVKKNNFVDSAFLFYFIFSFVYVCWFNNNWTALLQLFLTLLYRHQGRCYKTFEGRKSRNLRPQKKFYNIGPWDLIHNTPFS